MLKVVARLALVSVVVLTSAFLLPQSPDYLVRAEGFPCEMKDVSKTPGPLPPPGGLRIIVSELLEPLFRAVPLFAGAGAHPYYESLVSRPDCQIAFNLRSQGALDALKSASASSDKKLPVVYDPEQDAAKVTIYAPSSADIQGKFMPVRVSSGTMLLTWDFRFDEHFRWAEEGNILRHKTWRLNPGPWLAIRTDYKHAAGQGQFAELLLSLPASRFLGPGTTRGAPGWFGEMLQPALATFYFGPNTWVRVWIFVEGLDQPVCYLSAWAADERRDPIRLYDRIALLPNHEAGGLNEFQLEYDTSADIATNPTEMHSWNRNVVMLHNISPSAVPPLLVRPAP